MGSASATVSCFGSAIGSHLYATVERRWRERGFEMLRYRWSAGHAQGGGTLPLSERTRIFTLEQARERGFKMANALPEHEPASNASPAVTATSPGSEQAPATTTAAPKAGTQDGLTQAEQTEMLTAHNRWRRMVGVPDVSWSSSLAQSAQAWAGHIEQTRQCSIDASAHSNDPEVGENLAWRSALRYINGRSELQSATPTDITNDWAGEKKHYDHASNSCRGVCGHYTQIVWKSTREIGCGHAVCGNLSQVWVCRYAPPGNYTGQKPY